MPQVNNLSWMFQSLLILVSFILIMSNMNSFKLKVFNLKLYKFYKFSFILTII